MEFIKRNYSYILIVLLAAVVALVTVLSGKNGIYFFDLGIQYHYGWLVYKGITPYSEILTALGPLSGYLGAFAYKIFGVNYISYVYISAILCALEFIFISICFKKEMNIIWSILFSFAFIFASIPVMGTLYYNNLVVYFLVLILCCLYLKLFYKNSNLYTALMWSFIVLVGLTKFHIGFICAFLGLILEFIILKIDNQKITKQHLTAIFLPLLIGGLLLVLSAKFNISAIIYCISIPDMKFWTKMFNSWYSYSVLYLIVMLLSLTLFFINKKIDNIKLFLMLLYFACALALALYTTPDTKFTFLMLVAWVFLSIYKLVKINLSQFKIKYLYIVLLGICIIWTIVYDSEYIYRGGRKQWNEKDYRFQSDLKMGKARTHEGFFKHIRVRDSQLDAIKIIKQLADENKDKKIYLSSACEMFYPALKILPPRRWILWSHPGTSISVKQYPELEKTLAEENYDFIVFVKHRLHSMPYLNFKDLGFKYISGSKKYWFFVATKNEENAVSIQNIYNKITNLNETYEEIR